MEARGPRASAPLLAIVKAGVRTAENVSVVAGMTAAGTSAVSTDVSKQVADALAAPVHTISSPAVTVTVVADSVPVPGNTTVAVAAIDSLNCEASSAKVSGWRMGVSTSRIIIMCRQWHGRGA